MGEHLVKVYIHAAYLNEVLKIARQGLAADDIVLNGIAFGYEDTRIGRPRSTHNIIDILIEEEQDPFAFWVPLNDIRIHVANTLFPLTIVKVDSSLVRNIPLDLRSIECLVGIAFYKRKYTIAVRIVMCQELVKN
jgi:hypothetical protein